MRRFFTSLILSTLMIGTSFASDFSTFIFDGMPAEADEWRSVVAISYGGDFHCTGVLVKPHIVFTAAHCIHGFTKPRQNFRVHIGTGEDGVFEKSFMIQKAYVPKEYVKIVKESEFDYESDDYDYGFFLLDGFVERDLATPAKLARTPNQLRDIILNIAATKDPVVYQVGYGITEELGYGRKYSTQASYDFDDGTMIFLQANQTGVCAGDSGSPAFAKDEDGRWHVIGLLTSSSDELLPGFCGSDSNYVRIDNAYQFYHKQRGKTDQAIAEHLKYLHFGNKKAHNRAWRYRNVNNLHITVDDSPLKNGLPYFILNLGRDREKAIKIKMSFSNIESVMGEHPNVQRSLQKGENISYRLQAKRLSPMPQSSKDQKLFRKIFNCHKDRNWNKCLREFRATLSVSGRQNTQILLRDAHWWMGNQINLRWR